MSSYQFKIILKKPKSSSCGDLFFQFTPSSNALIGFSVGKSVGGAVLRNRFKRKCRALFFSDFFKLNSIHLIVRPKVPLCKIKNLHSSFEELKKHIAYV